MTDGQAKADADKLLVARMTSIRARYATNQGIWPDAEAYDLVQQLFGDGAAPSDQLPDEAVRRDRELDEAAETEPLRAHRWHWTLNTANPDRVAIGEYALAVGLPRSFVFADAQGYADELDGGPPRWGRRH
jgi:hypothetical protein